MFLVVGGAAARSVAGTPVPVAEQTTCRPMVACPDTFARPLEC